jgi:hypothetical protein
VYEKGEVSGHSSSALCREKVAGDQRKLLSSLLLSISLKMKIKIILALMAKASLIDDLVGVLSINRPTAS